MEDLAKPTTDEFARQIESAVVHYGDTTLTFLNNWYRADQRGNPYQYVSAVAVEEKSVIDYNSGNPDGVLQEGEEPREPNVPLVAIYPEEGTALLGQPPLRARRRVGRRGRGGRPPSSSSTSCSSRENQEQILQLRLPAREPRRVASAAPSTTATASTPTSRRRCSRCPQPEVLTQLLDDWQDQRKPARVLLLVDVSGSMSRASPTPTPAPPSSTWPSRPPSPRSTSSTTTTRWASGCSPPTSARRTTPRASTSSWSRPAGSATSRENLKTEGPRPGAHQRHAAVPRHPGSPTSSQVDGYDPTRINAVVLLSDGVNDDGEPDDDRDQLDELLSDAVRPSRGRADPGRARVPDLLRRRRRPRPRCAASPRPARRRSTTRATPARINKVFVAVVSNF